DRAAVARREHKPVERPLLTLGHEGAAEAEQGREENRDPEQANRFEPRGGLWQWKVEDDKHSGDEENLRGQRVSCAQLRQEVFPRERPDVAEVPHAASASR